MPIVPDRVSTASAKLLASELGVMFLKERYGWTFETIVDARLGIEDGKILFPSYDPELDQWHFTVRKWLGDEGPKFKHEGPPYPELYLPKQPGLPVWLCEGHPDTVTAMQLGFNAMGLVGTSTVGGVVERLKKFETVVTVMDADPAGWKATRALVTALIDHIQIRVAFLIPPGMKIHEKIEDLREDHTLQGMDLTDYVKKYGEKHVRHLLLNPVKGPWLLQLKNPPPAPPMLRSGPLDRDVGKIINALQCGKACPCAMSARRGQGLFHCPAHADPTPSFSVKVQNGTVLVHCFGACTQAEVIAALVEKGLWRKSEPRPTTYGTRSGSSGYRLRSGLGGNGAAEARLPSAWGFPRA